MNDECDDELWIAAGFALRAPDINRLYLLVMILFSLFITFNGKFRD